MNKRIKNCLILAVTIIVNLCCVFGWWHYLNTRYWNISFPIDEEVKKTEKFINQFREYPQLNVLDSIIKISPLVSGSVLPHALYLADCLNQPDAHYYVYLCADVFFSSFGEDIPDDILFQVVMPYLKRGAEMGSEACRVRWNNIRERI